ncbi:MULTISPECIES: cyclase family protein [Halomonadaceae]|uniref:cyclase family protein n=1 Tax=Halomonadaceae TaxID=28256 RepID=UPI00159A536D|nr:MULTISPECIES: cyclase family protein [Halomonas]QJQ95201.1 cyclase family protein [Halomonas sp. PA5]
MPTIIDLTLPLSDGLPALGRLARPVIIPHTTHEASKKFKQGTPDDLLTFSTCYMGMLDHTGTHVDALFHNNPEGATIDEMPIEMFMGKAVCLDLRHVGDRGDITREELEAAEQAAGMRVDGHIVLMCTGLNARHWPNDSICVNNAQVTADATRWLYERGSMVHGVEGPSTDRVDENLFENHRVCRDLGMVHYEWLWNLEALLGKGEFTFQGIPLRIEGGTGSPVRALAFVD